MSDESFKMIREVLYLKMKKDDENNIFNNMNNFSRDEFVFNETIKHCMYFFEELVEERDRLQKGMNHFYQKLARSQYVNKILKEALSKYVNAIENNHALLWNEIFEDFKQALKEVEEL